MSENRRTHRVWLSVLAGAALIGGPGCIIVDDDDDDVIYVEDDPPPPPPAPTVEEVSIDEGASLQANAGEGVGIFVEYEGAGAWHVWVTCDTEVTGAACAFDLFMEGADLELAASEDLEEYDELVQEGELLTARLDTSYDTDGVRLQLADDAALRLEVWLDGASDPRFVWWVSGGEPVMGAPSNPVDFVPNL